MLIVSFSGGIASQMFQYCFYMMLVEKYPNETVKADISKYKTAKRREDFRLEEYVDIQVAKRNEIRNCVYVHENEYKDWQYDATKNFLFVGCWQNAKYFPASISYLSSIITESALTEKDRAYLIKIKNSESVAIHVSRNDSVDDYRYGNIATYAYYQNAIEYIQNKIENPTYFIFTDDIDWCKEKLVFSTTEVYFVEGIQKDPRIALILMSQCKHNILANSSYSWWAQELNRYPLKMVITPEYWCNTKTGTEELFVSNAIKIKNYFEHKQCETPFFSVLIPAYNVQRFIRRCITSVISQSYDNMEIIIVDDGSTDETLNIISEYALSDMRIHLLSNKENKSLYMARYIAFKHAIGEYIILLDGDDYLSENACGNIYRELSGKKIDVLEYKYQREPSKSVSCLTNVDEGFVKEIVLGNIPYTVWNKCYSREVVKRAIGLMDQFYCNLGEDAYNSIALLSEAKNYSRLDCVIIHYMENTGISTAKAISESSLNNSILSITNLKKALEGLLCTRFGYDERTVDSFWNIIFDYLVSQVINQNTDLLHRLKGLATIDKFMGTNKQESYERKIDRSRYSKFRNSRIRKMLIKIYLATKQR